MFRRLAGFTVVLLLVACSASTSFQYQLPDERLQAPEAGTGFVTKPGWQSARFMVAAANPLATDAGYQVLKAGGSAVERGDCRADGAGAG
ncbi:MAG: hypothetical protein QM776_05690 [Rhodocyclaceae bacterium]